MAHGDPMNALIDQDDLRTERARERDARLEAQISALWDRVESQSSTERESQDAVTEIVVLIRRRSLHQLKKMEFERRMRMRADGKKS
jgi:hypothetical protein